MATSKKSTAKLTKALAQVAPVANDTPVADPFPFQESIPPVAPDTDPEKIPKKSLAFLHSGFLVDAGSQWFAKLPGRTTLAPVQVVQFSSRLVHLRDLDNEHVTGAYDIHDVVFVDAI